MSGIGSWFWPEGLNQSERFVMPRKSKSSDTPARVDHRPRVGAERRGRTRQRLIASAIEVFAQRAADANVIDKVSELAGVSRGTFYNYFRTLEELVEAVAGEVSNEILRIVNPLAQQAVDPSERVARGVRLVIELVRQRPVVAEFLVNTSPSAVALASGTQDVVMRDVADGIAGGQFTVSSEQLGIDLIVGPVLQTFRSILAGQVSPDCGADLAQAVLQSLGVTPARARRLAQAPMPEVAIPESSLVFQLGDAA